MVLKPQDVLVLLKLVAIGNAKWAYGSLAVSLSMSPSEVHAAIKRAQAARLAVDIGDRFRANTSNLKEFLIRGMKYVFIPERGEMTRGMPTRYAGPPLVTHFALSNEPPPVWPDLDGEVRGQSFSPLYKSVPMAAKKDASLYELLVLSDAIRGGSARECELAIKEISIRLDCYQNGIQSQS